MPAAPQPLIRFQVPDASRRALRHALEAAAGAERFTATVTAFDTADRRLLDAGLAWTMRRERGTWRQALHALDHSVVLHEVPAGGPVPAAALHGSSASAKDLRAIIADGQALEPVFVARLRGVSRTIRARRACVEARFVEGAAIVGGHRLALCEIEFVALPGPLEDCLALVQRWCVRHALVLLPLPLEVRVACVAARAQAFRVRPARRPSWPRSAGAENAFAVACGECLEQVFHNAAGLALGSEADREEFVHQLRVGIRRLRSALRSFGGWVVPPPPELVEGLKSFFDSLGTARDSDVLGGSIARALARAGAPPLAAVPETGAASPRQLVVDAAVQGLLLRWRGWLDARLQLAAGDRGLPVEALPARIQRRLKRWHRRISEDAAAFESLDEPAFHDLRKRIKRQRYALEFFAPALPRAAVQRYLKPLAAAQERMGELNDLFVARDRYLALVQEEPAAWFALGWLAARIAQLKAELAPVLRALAKAEPPAAR